MLKAIWQASGLSRVGAAEGPDPPCGGPGCASLFSPAPRWRASCWRSAPVQPTAGCGPTKRPPSDAFTGGTRPGRLLKHRIPLKVDRSRLHGNGPGGALGPLGGGRVRLHLECHRRLQGVDGVSSGSGARPGGGGASTGGDGPSLALPLAGDRYRQWVGSQRARGPLVCGARHPVRERRKKDDIEPKICVQDATQSMIRHGDDR